jgi:ATP-dependent Clp protease ATP-binding subunit ClpA
VEDDALELVVAKGFSMAFGARFLKRFIDEHIKLPISAQWKAGSHFDVKARDGQLVVEPGLAQVSTVDAAALGDVV